jgi:hypothetical protein
LAGLDIDDIGLLRGDGRECFDLAVIVAKRFAKGREVNGVVINKMQTSKRVDSRTPPIFINWCSEIKNLKGLTFRIYVPA